MHHGRQKHANQMPVSPQQRHVRATPSQHHPPCFSSSSFPSYPPPTWSWRVTSQVGPIARGMKGTEGMGWEKLGSDGRVGKVPIRRQGGWRNSHENQWGFLSNIVSCNCDGAFSLEDLSGALSLSRSHTLSLSLPLPTFEFWPTRSRSPPIPLWGPLRRSQVQGNRNRLIGKGR